MDGEWKLMVNGLTLSMDDPQTRLTVQVNINFHFTFKVFDMTRLTYQETCVEIPTGPPLPGDVSRYTDRPSPTRRRE